MKTADPGTKTTILCLLGTSLSSALVLGLALIEPAIVPLRVSAFFALGAAIVAGFFSLRLVVARLSALPRTSSEGEDELRRISDLHKACMDSSSDLIYLKDRSSRMRYCNLLTQNLIGKSEAELFGKNDVEYLGPGRGGEEIMETDTRIMESGQGETIEEWVKWQDGSQRVYLSKKEPFRDSQGNIIGLFGISRDVTEMKRTQEALESSEERCRDLANSMPQLVWTATAAGEQDYFNEKADAYAGFRKDNDGARVGKPVVHPDDEEREQRTWQEALSGGELYQTELRLKMADGNFRWHLARGIPAKNARGQVTKWYGTYTDIESLKETQKTLLKQIETVEMEREKFEAAFHCVSDAIFLFDLDGNPVFINDAARRILGYVSIQEMMIHLDRYIEIFELRDAEGNVIPVEHWPLARAHRGESFQDWELHACRKDTGRSWVWLYSGVPVRESATGLRLGLVTMRDVTSQKKAEEELKASESKFRTMANVMPQMVWSTRADGYHDFYNARWYEFTGVPLGVTDGEGWNDLFHPDDRERAKNVWQQSLATGNPYEIEYRLKHHSGEYRWTLGRALPIRDAHGQITRWMGTCTDIHELKLLESDLKEALQARDEFLSIASHELKTPISSLKLQAQIASRLRSRGDGSIYSPEKVNRFIDQTERQVERIHRLVDDMLDVARIRSGQLTIAKETLELGALVTEVIERLAPEFRMGDTVVTFECSELFEGSFDRFRMEQMITNLLTNAMRYGHQKPIHVALRRTSQGDHRVRLLVRDQGMGITPEALERIFHRFERNVSANEVSGLGLGLFITRQIVETHDGRVWAESDGAGMGSTFIVELPLGVEGALTVALQASP